MKRCFYLTVVAIGLLFAVGLVGGCSVSSPGMPESQPLPSQEDAEIVGDWAGSWVSYTASDKFGKIDPISFEAVENADGSMILSGEIKTTGLEDFTDGAIEGTLSGSTVNFNASFEKGPVMVFTGTLSRNTINGTYKLFSEGQEVDAGSFYLTKKL